MGVTVRSESRRGQRIDLWSGLVVLCALLLLAPLIAVFIGVFQPTEEWQHLVSTVLPGYLLNTMILVLGVSLVSILFALPTAWLTHFVPSADSPGPYGILLLGRCRFFFFGLDDMASL